MAKHIFGEVTMRIDHRTASICEHILQDAILQEFTFAAPGESDYIGMKFAHLGRNAKCGEEVVPTDASQPQIVWPASEDL